MDAMAGMPCAARVASFVGRPCSGRATVVGAHLPGVPGKGMSTKPTDLAVIAACHACHQIIDRVDLATWEAITSRYPAAYANQLLRALVETQSRLVALGIITVKGSDQ